MSPPPHAPSPQAPYGYKVRSHTVYTVQYTVRTVLADFAVFD